jgi:hypothetical protein
MARTRQIKPSFFVNEDMVELPFHTRLLFIGLLTIADRRGVLEDRPKKIKMALFPADNFDIDQSLSELDKYNFIHRYTVDGAGYIHIVEFVKHQNPHREEKANNMPLPHYLEAANTVQSPDAGASKPDAGSVAESDKQDASTVQARCSEDAGSVAAQLVPVNLYLETRSSNNTHSTPEVIGEPSMQGLVCVELQKMGIYPVNPQHVGLIELIEQGAEMQDFISAGIDALNKSKGFAYALGIVRGKMEEKKQKSQSDPSRSHSGSTKNNSRGNYDTNHGNNEAGQHSGRKLSLVEQAQRGIELIEARERREREQQASILA